MLMSVDWNASQVITLIAAVVAATAAVVAAVIAAGSTHRRWLREVRYPAYAAFAAASRRALFSGVRMSTAVGFRLGGETVAEHIADAQGEVHQAEQDLYGALRDVDVVGSSSTVQAANEVACAWSLIWNLAHDWLTESDTYHQRLSEGMDVLNGRRVVFLRAARADLGVRERRWFGTHR